MSKVSAKLEENLDKYKYLMYDFVKAVSDFEDPDAYSMKELIRLAKERIVMVEKL